MNEIELIITTDNSGLVTGVRTASGEVMNFGKTSSEAADKASSGFKKLINDADNFKLKMSDIDRMMAAGFGYATLYMMERQFMKSIEASEMMQNSLRGLAGMARYAGENIETAIGQAYKFTEDGLLNVREASLSLQNLLQRGYGLERSIELMERLKDAAAFNRQSHLSMGEAITSATEGLKNENSILVDNAGVTKNVSIMWKEYAAQIGKGVDSLTIAQKREAEYQGIMRETEGMLGNAKLATEGLTGAKAQLRNEVFKLRAGLGDSLTPAFLELGKAANWVLENALKPFVGGLEITGARIGLWWEKLSVIFSESWKGVISGGGIVSRKEEIKKQLAELDKVFDEHATEIAKKWGGGMTIPQIGRDTGKRRQDVIAPEKELEKVKSLNKRIQHELEQMTLSQIDQIKAQAAEWIKEGGNRVLVEKWATAETNKIRRDGLLNVLKLNQEQAELEKKTEQEVADFKIRLYEAERQRNEDLFNQAVQLNEQRKQMQREQYETMWQGVLGQTNMVGGEMGVGLGMMAGGMKGLMDVEQGYDPYSQELERLQQYYADRIALLQEMKATEAEINQQYEDYMVQQEAIAGQQRLLVAQNLAGMLAGTMYSLYVAAGQHNDAMFKMWKAFAIAEALISTYAGAARALAEWPWPFSIAVAAIVTATGLARVAAIASQKPGTAATSAGVSGGGGYTYTQPTVPSFQPAEQEKEKTRPLTVTIYNYGILGTDQDQIARDLVPALQKAMDDGAH
ncbi:MAG: hypothetical protein AB1805_07615 [Nitrospirota bacterium]